MCSSPFSFLFFFSQKASAEILFVAGSDPFRREITKEKNNAFMGPGCLHTHTLPRPSAARI